MPHKLSRYHLYSDFPTPLLRSRCRAAQEARPWCLRSNKADTLRRCIRLCASASPCIMQSISYSLSQKDILPLVNNTVVICGCYCSDRPVERALGADKRTCCECSDFHFHFNNGEGRKPKKKNTKKQNKKIENRKKKTQNNISTGRYHLSFAITASQRLLFSLSSL